MTALSNEEIVQQVEAIGPQVNDLYEALERSKRDGFTGKVAEARLKFGRELAEIDRHLRLSLSEFESLIEDASK